MFHFNLNVCVAFYPNVMDANIHPICNNKKTTRLIGLEEWKDLSNFDVRWCLLHYHIITLLHITLSIILRFCLFPGDQCQEAIPAGSCATSSQKDNPQTRADRGAEAGDQGGLWALWHWWIWIHWRQGAQGKTTQTWIISFHVANCASLPAVPGCDESSGLWTEEGGDQKDDRGSGQGWHREDLLHWFPGSHDTEDGKNLYQLIQ